MTRFKLSIFLWLLGTGVVVAAEQAKPTEAEPTAVDDTWFTVSVGGGIKRVTLTISGNKKGDEKAVLAGTDTAPVVRIATGDLLDNPKNNWRFILEAGYSEFATDHQEVEDRKVDYGTSVEGEYQYLMPAVYYSDVPKGGDPFYHSGLLFSFGIGLARVDATGTVVFAKENPSKVREIDLAGKGVIFQTYIGYQLGNFEFTANLTGIAIKNQNKDSNNYALSEAGLLAMYKLHF